VNGPSVQDRAEIEDLYARYMWALDTDDPEAFAACFTPRALMYEVQPDGSVSSHRALAFFEEGFHDNPERSGHQHRYDNLVYSDDPQRRPDHWETRAYVFATVAERNLPGSTEHPSARTTWSGHYLDTVAKVDGEWRFVERNIAPWTGERGVRLAER
jgi:SnoaL-like domain